MKFTVLNHNINIDNIIKLTGINRIHNAHQTYNIEFKVQIWLEILRITELLFRRLV